MSDESEKPKHKTAEQIVESDPALILTASTEDLDVTMEDEKMQALKQELKGQLKGEMRELKGELKGEMREEMSEMLKGLQDNIFKKLEEQREPKNEGNPIIHQAQSSSNLSNLSNPFIPPFQRLPSSSNKKYAFNLEEQSIKSSTALAISKYISDVLAPTVKKSLEKERPALAQFINETRKQYPLKIRPCGPFNKEESCGKSTIGWVHPEQEESGFRRGHFCGLCKEIFGTISIHSLFECFLVRHSFWLKEEVNTIHLIEEPEKAINKTVEPITNFISRTARENPRSNDSPIKPPLFSFQPSPGPSSSRGYFTGRGRPQRGRIRGGLQTRSFRERINQEQEHQIFDEDQYYLSESYEEDSRPYY